MHNADSAARAQGSSPGTRPLMSDSEDFRRQAKSCRALAAQALRPQQGLLDATGGGLGPACTDGREPVMTSPAVPAEQLARAAGLALVVQGAALRPQAAIEPAQFYAEAGTTPAVPSRTTVRFSTDQRPEHPDNRRVCSRKQYRSVDEYRDPKSGGIASTSGMRTMSRGDEIRCYHSARDRSRSRPDVPVRAVPEISVPRRELSRVGSAIQIGEDIRGQPVGVMLASLRQGDYFIDDDFGHWIVFVAPEH